MKYSSYKFLYPPRPENKISPARIVDYDNGDYAAQIKYNGDCCPVFLPGPGLSIIRNRHNQPKTKAEGINLGQMHNGNGWMVVCGELMDKSKKGEDGEILKGFIIWDILVWNGEYLVGSTLRQRLELLETMFPSVRMAATKTGLQEFEHLLFTGIPGIYRAPTYVQHLDQLFKDVVPTDAYEGLVLKKLDAKLELGFHEKNNSAWQLKARKETKNYQF